MTRHAPTQHPRRRRPVVGAFVDEDGCVRLHRLAQIMRQNGASPAEINEALGVNLRYAGINDAPSSSRPVRPDVRVAQIMRVNGAYTREIATALGTATSTVEAWLHNQRRFSAVVLAA